MRYWIYVLLILGPLPTALAQQPTLTGELSLEQAIISTLERNPLLLANDYEARAAASRIRQAQQKPAIEASLELEDFIGTGDFNGIDQAQATLSLGTILERAEKATLRGTLAEQEVMLLRNAQDSRRLDLLANTAVQFIDTVVAQHRLEIAQQQIQLIERTHEIVSHRVRVGKSHIAEQRRTAINLSRSKIELEHAEHLLASYRVKLATAWGDTNAGFSSASADLFKLPTVAAFRQLETRLANNPDLIQYASEERVAQARLRVAQTRNKPDISLSGGIRYYNRQDDAALVFSASLPFDSESRAKPFIDEMEMMALREPHRYQQQHLNLYASLYEIYQELIHAKHAFDVLNNNIIPQSERAASDYETGYKSGRFSLLELNEAQQTLVNTRLERVIAAGNYHRFRIEIERLTGAALHAGARP